MTEQANSLTFDMIGRLPLIECNGFPISINRQHRTLRLGQIIENLLFYHADRKILGPNQGN